MDTAHLTLRFRRSVSTEVLSVDMSSIVGMSSTSSGDGDGVGRGTAAAQQRSPAFTLPYPDAIVLQMWCAWRCNAAPPPVDKVARDILLGDASSSAWERSRQAHMMPGRWLDRSGVGVHTFPCGLGVRRPNIVVVVCATDADELPQSFEAGDRTSFLISVYTKVVVVRGAAAGELGPAAAAAGGGEGGGGGGQASRSSSKSFGGDSGATSVVVHRIAEKDANGVVCAQRVAADVVLHVEDVLRRCVCALCVCVCVRVLCVCALCVCFVCVLCVCAWCLCVCFVCVLCVYMYV